MSDLKNKSFSIGTKFYRYDDDKLITVRVRKLDPKNNSYQIIYEANGKIEWISNHELSNGYIKLNEDGIVAFNILKTEKQDVMVCIHRATEYTDPVPFALCRQDVVDIFSMYVNPPEQGKAYAGISVNRNNCPAEMDMKDFMLCDDVLFTKFIAVYLDDTLDDILGLVYTGRYDKVLDTLYKYRKGTNIIGNDANLKDLLTHHNFMYDFHEAFGVTEIPFTITNDTEHLLIDIISQIEAKAVTAVYVIPYDKSVNTDEFERPFKLMTPDWSKCEKEDQKIWIVGYDIDESVSYLKNKYGTDDKDEIIKQLGFNVM